MGIVIKNNLRHYNINNLALKLYYHPDSAYRRTKFFEAVRPIFDVSLTQAFVFE